MALPEPVPALSEPDFNQVLREMDEYEMSEEQRSRIERHEAVIEAGSD